MNISKAVRALTAGGLGPLISWPLFSATSYLVGRRLQEMGIAPSTVLDVGANVGQFSVAIANLLQPRTLIAFEPTPSCYESLRDSTRALGNVECVKAAVGSEDRQVEMNFNKDSRSKIGISGCVSDPRPSKRRCVTTAPRPLARSRECPTRPGSRLATSR